MKLQIFTIKAWILLSKKMETRRAIRLMIFVKATLEK